MPSTASPPQTLVGKVAIVTGASRGIGETIAYDLASRGANVCITFTSDRSQKGAEALRSRIESETTSKAITVQCNLAEEGSAAKIVNETVKAFKHIDILVNNAAVMVAKPVADLTAEDFTTTFHTNVRAPLFMVQAVLPYLRRPGRIISMSSVGARGHYAGTSVYQASKAALEGFTRGWAADLGGDGTTVNCVNPGPVQSEMLDQVPREIVEPQMQATPIQKRVGTAQEIAEIVAFLAEPRSSWVTGQCISASGGYAVY